MTIERRTYKPIELRVDDATKGQIIIKPLTYDAKDSYGTKWSPGVFTDYVDGGGHTATVWGHEWTDPIGHMVDYSDGKDGPTTVHQLDLVAEVPRALQAWAQTRSGTIQDASVGFERQEWSNLDDDPDGAYERITKAALPEVSLVVRGAVPGAKVLGIRSNERIDRDIVIEMAHALQDGQMTLVEAERLLGEPDVRMALRELRAKRPTETVTTTPAVDGEIAEAMAILEGM